MNAKTPGNPQLLLRIPPEIQQLLARECAERDCTPQTIVIESLNDRFGVAAPLPARGGQPKERRKAPKTRSRKGKPQT